MKVLFYVHEAQDETLIQQPLPGVEVLYRRGSLADEPSDKLEPDIDVLSIFVDNPLGPTEFARFPNLKLIAARSTGVDHIDMTAARACGVMVVNVPSYGAPTVAEFAFALMLALSRRICDIRKQQLSQKEIEGFDLFGKTIGIVGCGRIGVHVAEIAAGFGMRILAFDEYPDEKLTARIGLQWVSLGELLANSDIVTLHVPATPATHHLIGGEAFSRMKKGAYLINTARGAVVDTVALVAALKSGKLAGAGIDVLEDEKEISEENKYLYSNAHVIVTPHVAFDTREATKRILDTTIQNIAMFFAGSPQNIVSS